MVAVADKILELQRDFDDAELRGDADRLDALLADDFLSIGEQGYQLGKREWIDRHRDFRYLSVETAELDLRHYGTTAIVRCIQRSRATWRGEEMALAVRLSQVWIQEPDGWQLVAIQFSTLGTG
jgi:ketosteroid isomerase-like protein